MILPLLSLLCLGFTFGSAGFVGSTGEVIGVTEPSSHAHLDVNVIFSEKPEEPLKIKELNSILVAGTQFLV